MSPSGYYDWLRRKPSRRKRDDLELVRQIEKVFVGSRKAYGSPRVLKALKELGYSGGRKRIERLMRQNGIKAKTKKRFRVQTTDSKHGLPIAPDLVKRDFSPPKPNQVWASDITYIRTKEGWLYLAVVLDLFSRTVVGWSMESKMTASMVGRALKMALGRRKTHPGIIHHSDRGAQYASLEYQMLLNRYGFRQSMSRKGNCYDNAVVESFFHTLKTELVHWHNYGSKTEARNSIFEWIEVFYNRRVFS